MEPEELVCNIASISWQLSKKGLSRNLPYQWHLGVDIYIGECKKTQR